MNEKQVQITNPQRAFRVVAEACGQTFIVGGIDAAIAQLRAIGFRLEAA